MKNEQQLIQDVHAYANNRYNDGWSVIVECWTTEDILKVLLDTGDFTLTIMELQEYVNAYLQKQEDIESTSF
jgi:hypothetical protein